ncbi:leucine-rich repeat protein [Tanacetum coccineum]
MSALSFSHFSSCYLCLLVVVALFHLCLSNQNFDDVLCIKEERQALLQFKHRLVDEGGRLASWVGEQNDCCKWAGIVCDNKTGHVHQIHLRALDGHCQFDEYKEEEASKQKLKGDLSLSLLDLKQLKHLDLSCNDFGWIQVPEYIGSLGSLRYLNLSSSNFSGIIPPQLGNISQLQTLCLGCFQVDVWDESTSVVNMEWLSNPKSHETLTRPRFAFRIVRTQTRYDRDSDRSGSRSGSLYSAFPEHINQRTEVYWYDVPKSISTAYRSLLSHSFSVSSSHSKVSSMMASIDEDVEKSSLADQDDAGCGNVKSLKKNDLLDMLVPRMLRFKQMAMYRLVEIIRIVFCLAVNGWVLMKGLQTGKCHEISGY